MSSRKVLAGIVGSCLLLWLLGLVACGGGGASANNSGTTTPPPTPDPSCSSFAASPASIAKGSSSTLSWVCSNASVSIDNGIGAVAVSGSQSVSPAATTTYTLTASGNGKSVTHAATVTVSAPAVTVSISPTAATVSAGSTQQFTATVTGSANTTVTWSASGGSVNASGLFTAPASAGTVSVTATSVADPTKSANAIVTVTAALSLGGGTINFIPTDSATASWSSQDRTCFNNYLAVLLPAMTAIAGKPALSFDVSVKIDPAASSGNYNLTTKEMVLPPTSGGSTCNDPGFYALFTYLATYAWYDCGGLCGVPADQQTGMAYFTRDAVSSYLFRSGKWQSYMAMPNLGYVDAYQDADNRASLEIAAAQDEESEYALLSLSQSACAFGDWVVCSQFNATLHEELYRRVNDLQRPLVPADYASALDAVGVNLTDGMKASAWVASRITAPQLAADGQYFGVAAWPRVNPSWIRLLATNRSQGVDTPIAAGHAFVELIDRGGNVFFSITQDLSSHIFIIENLTTLPLGSFTVRATYFDATGKVLDIVTNVAAGGVPSSITWTPDSLTPAVFLIATTRDGSGNLWASGSTTWQVTDGAVVYTAPGVARVMANCTADPCTITANDGIISVPAPLVRAVAVPAR